MQHEPPHGARLARWKRITEWPMFVLAVAFVALYAYSVVGNLRGDAARPFDLALGALWVAFALEYVVCLALARDRGRWFVRHLHEFAIVALPFLRPLRLLRLITVVTVLQRAAGWAFRGRVTLYVIASATLLVLIAGLGVLDAEQNAPGANITTFGDAIWWAFVTITTVGYGDYFPTTGTGRLIAVGLMIAGIALIGSVTATFASWFVEQIARQQRDDAAPAPDGEAELDASRHARA